MRHPYGDVAMSETSLMNEIHKQNATINRLYDALASVTNDLRAMVDGADRNEVWVVNQGTRIRLSHALKLLEEVK